MNTKFPVIRPGSMIRKDSPELKEISVRIQTIEYKIMKHYDYDSNKYRPVIDRIVKNLFGSHLSWMDFNYYAVEDPDKLEKAVRKLGISV